jgi:hypothetical protein
VWTVRHLQKAISQWLRQIRDISAIRNGLTIRKRMWIWVAGGWRLFCKAESRQMGYENQSSTDPQGGARFTETG